MNMMKAYTFLPDPTPHTVLHRLSKPTDIAIVASNLDIHTSNIMRKILALEYHMMIIKEDSTDKVTEIGMEALSSIAMGHLPHLHHRPRCRKIKI